MPKYNVKILREIDLEIEADTLENAGAIARKCAEQIGQSKVLSVLAEGAEVETFESPDFDSPPPRGKPTGGGSPGTPTVKTPVLADQIAKVA